jgi:hypothetical protein
MLKQAIIACPESLWNDERSKNRFWQVAYHALFSTQEYVAIREETYTPWHRHRRGYQDFDGPLDVEPYDKAAILEYLAFCEQEVEHQVPGLKLAALERHGDRTLVTLELQLYSIRHIMQHAGELMERLSANTDAEVDWVGWKHP